MNSPYSGKFKVTQQYKGTAHDGLDLVGIDSKEIHSTTDGVVEWADWENRNNKKQGFGLYVRIKQTGNVNKYYFAHLSSVKVKAGDKVKVGQVIGIEGSTGKSTGSHVHYCIRGNGSKAQIRDVSAISGIPNKVGTYTDGPAPTKAPEVTYQVYANKRWLPMVTGTEDYAGIRGDAITAVKADVTRGHILYQVHTVGGKWYPWVKDLEDFAGVIGKPIDAVRAKLSGVKGYVLQTRVAPSWGSYLPWVTNDEDYAGIYGKAIDRLQMRIMPE